MTIKIAVKNIYEKWTKLVLTVFPPSPLIVLITVCQS